MATLGAVLFGGCLDESPFQPLNHSVVVHAVLDVDSRNQYIIVQQVDGASGTQTQVTGATVAISGPDGRALLAREVTDTLAFQSSYHQVKVNRVYRLSLDEYGVTLVEGQQYSLRVTTAAGEVVTGTTIIPVNPVPAPPAGVLDTIDPTRDSILVSWTPGKYAKAYDLTISYTGAFFIVPTLIYRTFVDSSFFLSPRSSTLSSYVLQNNFLNDIIVLGVDANYYDYYRRGTSLLGASGVVNHLTGGVGVFGSVGRVSRQRVWARYPGTPR